MQFYKGFAYLSASFLNFAYQMAIDKLSGTVHEKNTSLCFSCVMFKNEIKLLTSDAKTL